MSENNWLAWGAALILFVVIAALFIRIVPRVIGKQCPKCLRRVPMGRGKCPACGTIVNARTDLAK